MLRVALSKLRRACIALPLYELLTFVNAAAGVALQDPTHLNCFENILEKLQVITKSKKFFIKLHHIPVLEVTK
jgi:hypothetical protein